MLQYRPEVALAYAIIIDVLQFILPFVTPLLAVNPLVMVITYVLLDLCASVGLILYLGVRDVLEVFILVPTFISENVLGFTSFPLWTLATIFILWRRGELRGVVEEIKLWI